MTPMSRAQQPKDRPGRHKGAIEGDRPTDEQQGNPNGDGVDENGMPERSGGDGAGQASGRTRTSRRVEKAAIGELAIW